MFISFPGKIVLLITVLIILTGRSAFTQGSYYNSINLTSPTFVTDLESRIRSPYNRISYDNFDETNIAQFAAHNNGNGTKSVFCVYTGYEHIYTGTFAWGLMSREHTYAHSWMATFPNTNNDQYSDQHHLFPTHQNNANGRRSNHPFGEVQNVTYQFLEGKVGTNSSGQIVYEPMESQKGDVARTLYYMIVRYDGISGDAWSLSYLNNTQLPSLSEGPQDTTVLYNWHRQDPPDKWEVDRNNYIQSIQQNRNPFVDHPEYAAYINFYNLNKYNPVFSAEPTNYVTSFSSAANGSSIQLSWTDATGAQLPSGYIIMAYTPDNYFLPIDGSVYAADTVLSDGYALKNVSYADANNISFSNLIPNTTYYFSIFPYNGSGSLTNYKIDGAFPRTNATSTNLLAAEPTNYITNLNSGSITDNSLQLSWTDALAGSQAPSGYLLVANNNNSFTNPSDGVQYSNDTVLSDGNSLINISYASPDIYNYSSLLANTNYFFKVFSYNGSGSMINYKTDGSAPYIIAATTGSSQNAGTILLDNFNRANTSSLGSTLPPDALVWLETETVNPTSLIINNNRTKYASTTAGRELAFVNMSGKSGYPAQYNTSAGQLIWAVNFRQSRSDPSGFDANNYGAAFIIGKTTSDLTSGNGYAVVLGQSGSADAIRLAKFTNGVNTNSKFTSIISGGDYSNQYLSIKVIYESTSDTWKLFVDSSSAGFPHSDPRNASAQIGQTTDTAYTSTPLIYLGMMWNHATGVNDSLIADEIYVPSVISTTINIKSIAEGFYNTGSAYLNKKDTLTAYLRNTTSPFAITDSSKAVCDTITFISSFIFENTSAGSYYIEIKGKNTIETWSKIPKYITAGSVNDYDFTISADKAYGDNLVFKNSEYCIYSGDVNQDGIIDLTDLLAIYNDAENFITGNAVTDINGDRFIDLTDLLITYNNSTVFVSRMIPE